MRIHCISNAKRIVSLTFVFVVLLLLLPMKIAESGYSYETTEYFELRQLFSNYSTLTEEEKAELAQRMKWMSAEEVNAALQQATAFWTQEQKIAFVNWLIENHFFATPCSLAYLQLYTEFSVPEWCGWPANIPTPKQGSIIMQSEGGNSSTYVLGGTTRLTYEEMKSRIEASSEWLADNDGTVKQQLEDDIARDFYPYGKTAMEYLADFGIEIMDEAYYSRTDNKGKMGLAFGGNTTALILSQEVPENTAVDPYPILYNSNISAAAKRALLFSLLNMVNQDQRRQVIEEIMATLTDDEYYEFLSYLEQELRALEYDTNSDLYGWLKTMLGD